MTLYKKKRIYIPPGATVVWKKNKLTGERKPVVVMRRGYFKTILTKV